jgi:hypothetical protein
MMNWKGSVCGLILRYYPSIHLDGLRKTAKILSQVNRSPGRYLNLGPPEYEAGVLSTRPRRLVKARSRPHYGELAQINRLNICSK